MKKLYSVASVSAAVILFLIIVSSTASASITETWITNHGTARECCDIYNNTVVWTDLRNGNADIYIYDLSTKTEIHTNKASDQYDPAIYGNKVVWIDTGDLYLQDLSTKEQTRITTNGTAGNTAIYGNEIVWMDWRNGERDPDIYTYDISTKKETRITITGSAWDPAIYGNNIVWADGIPGVGNIYMYNLSTKTKTQITDDLNQWCPDIYGNNIVWADMRNGNADIYMYDLSTKKETQITNNASDQIYPAVYGNSIVWQDSRNGNWNIYAYDLSTHQQVHTTDKVNQYAPKIYNNKVVWRNSNDYYEKADIYLGTLSYLPVAAFSASPTTGNHPLNVQFTDKSTDAYYYSWNFGDKSSISTLQNPAHKYAAAGSYTVSFTVKNAAGSNTAKKTSYITVK